MPRWNNPNCGFQKGHPCLFKTPPFLGKHHTAESNKKNSEAQRGKKNHGWKGDEVGYRGLHIWVELKLGNPNYCEICKRIDRKRYEWSNKSGKYFRKISDWQRLCASCHRRYDIKNKIHHKN